MDCFRCRASFSGHRISPLAEKYEPPRSSPLKLAGREEGSPPRERESVCVLPPPPGVSGILDGRTDRHVSGNPPTSRGFFVGRRDQSPVPPAAEGGIRGYRPSRSIPAGEGKNPLPLGSGRDRSPPGPGVGPPEQKAWHVPRTWIVVSRLQGIRTGWCPGVLSPGIGGPGRPPTGMPRGHSHHIHG